MIICYFGIYDPQFGRNRIYLQALRNAGHTVVECRDTSAGLRKYWRLWRQHQAIKGSYDALVVGYPGHIVTPLAKLVSSKKVGVDALGSLYDAECNSHYPTFFKKLKARLADWLMVKFADKIFLETKEQQKYFEQKFGPSKKYEVIYTGAATLFNQEAHPESSTESGTFQVVFRGKLTPESGIMYILKAAETLKADPNISFRIIGSGYLLNQVTTFVAEHQLDNVELVSQFLSDEELVESLAKAKLMLGQFENNPRLNRTIPHKAFEAFAGGVPYLSGAAPAIQEIVQDGVTGFLVPLANADALAVRIKILAGEPLLLNQVGDRAKQEFERHYSAPAIAQKIVKIML